MKIRTKTTLLFLFAFISLILIFSWFIYFSVKNYSYADFYRLLEIRVITAAKSKFHVNEASVKELATLKEDFFEKLPHEKDYFFKLDNSFNAVAISKQLDVPEAFFESILNQGKAEFHHNQTFYLGMIYDAPDGKYIVIATAENYFELHHFAYLSKILLFAILTAILFSVFISFYLSKYIFNPLVKMTNKVKDISSENLHLRLETRPGNDEMNELSNTFNDVLNRIETSFATQNNFISNASHELKTPITAIIGETDVILSKPRTNEEYIETLKIILDEAEKLNKKTNALLFLAQTGFNGKVQQASVIRIDQLIWDVKETIEKIYTGCKIHINHDLLPENPKKLKVFCNEQLLHLAFSNIVINACKYSDFKEVNIYIGSSHKNVFVIIKDTGIGIPNSELKNIYDPFFRASNTGKYQGYGIGLPLARNIIRMFHGSIEVSSVINEGTTVQVNLPIADIQKAE